jgi:hypothetical protein
MEPKIRCWTTFGMTLIMVTYLETYYSQLSPPAYKQEQQIFSTTEVTAPCSKQKFVSSSPNVMFHLLLKSVLLDFDQYLEIYNF